MLALQHNPHSRRQQSRATARLEEPTVHGDSKNRDAPDQPDLLPVGSHTCSPGCLGVRIRQQPTHTGCPSPGHQDRPVRRGKAEDSVMFEAALIALIISGIGWAVSCVPVRGSGGKTKWWSLLPSSKANVHAPVLAMSTLKKRESVTLIRQGEKGKPANLWVGVTNKSRPENLARAIANAGGCKLGPKEEPPDPDELWRWWVSSPRVQNRTFNPRQYDDPVQFTDYANGTLDSGDLLVITAKLSSDKRTIRAAGMSTCEDMASSWCNYPSPKARPIRPHPALLFSVAGPLSGIVVLIFKGFSLPQNPIVYVIAVLAIAFAVSGGRSAVLKSPLARRMIRKGPVPVPREKGSLISRLRGQEPRWLPASISMSQIAAWAFPGK